MGCSWLELWLGGVLSTYSFCKKTSRFALDRAEPQEHNEYMSMKKKRSRFRSRRPEPPVDLGVELGKAIREERESGGLTLAQVSEKSDFDVAVLEQMEAGIVIPTQDEMTVLSRALNDQWLLLAHLAFVADQQRRSGLVPS
jgi:ribosome-binding protein aMBF1 (putative translation factor)